MPAAVASHPHRAALACLAAVAALLLAAAAAAEETQPGFSVENETETRSVLTPQSGDVLSIPDESPAPPPPVALPSRGMSMDQVERRFGAPRSRQPAVGQPPITRWDYDGFNVFFEHRTVLHVVRPGAPAPIYNKDKLLPSQLPAEPADETSP